MEHRARFDDALNYNVVLGVKKFVFPGREAVNWACSSIVWLVCESYSLTLHTVRMGPNE